MSATSRFVTYQFDVYLQGLAGQQSPLPLRYEDLEARARDVMEPGPFWYVAGGAGEDELRGRLVKPAPG